MKVICIDSKTRFQKCDLKEGGIYTIIDNNGCGQGCCYKLLESELSWAKDRFIPTSNIDETELVNEIETIFS